MFLIVNDEIPIRFLGTSASLGLNGAGEFALNPVTPFCQLSCNGLGEWSITPVTDAGIQINHAKVVGLRKVFPSDFLQLEQHTIEFRFHEQDKIVARAVQERQYKLLADLHLTVMDVVGTSSTELSQQEYRQRLESAIDKALEKTGVEEELEEFLSSQALREILLDSIHGYGNKFRKTASSENKERFAPLAEGLKKTIRVNPNETAEQKAERVDLLLPWALQNRRVAVLPEEHQALAKGLLREQLLDIIFGLGPLEDLMVAPDVNDIMVLPTGQIYIERGGRIQDSGRRMASPVISSDICQRLVGQVGRSLNQTSSMVDARMPDGSRLNAVAEPVSLYGPALTIRRFPQKRLTVDNLIEKGSISREIAAFLRACVIARKNIVIAGGTGSGKTTMINALASFIPATERIVTVEDTAEVQLAQEHTVTLQARMPNLEGKGAIPIRALVRNALRMRPDRIIVGECRSGETLDMLQAMNTGHDGSMTTLHANNPQDAILRLEVMALEAEGIDLPSRAIREIIAAATDLLIQVKRLPDGSRCVTSICEVAGFDEEDGVVIVEEIFKLRYGRKQPEKSATKLEFTGYVPNFIDELLRLDGVTIDTLF
jgi:Flp pilus assembly CpaF family ATPase